MRARVETSSWSLVVFTLAAQAAAGAALMRALLPWLLPDPPSILLPLVSVQARRPALAEALDPLGLIALLLLAVGALSAVAHLTRPHAARLAVSHLGSSWLSREILLGSLFGVVLLVDLLLGWFGGAESIVHSVLLWVAAVLGLALVYAIVRVYRLRTVPTWNTRATPIAFFGATVLLGVAAAAVVFVVGGGQARVTDQSLRSLGLIAAGIVVMELWTLWHHLTKLGSEGGAAAQGARAVLQVRRGMLNLRTFLGAFGALIFVAGTEEELGTQTPGAVLIGCVLLLAAEVIGRYLFYASHRRVGL